MRAGETLPSKMAPGSGASGPARAGFARLAAALFVGVTLAGLALAEAPTGLIPALAFALAAAVAGWLFGRETVLARLGPANAVTMLRLALATLLLLPLVRPDLAASLGGGWAVFALALATLALDGLDGPLARRSGLASAFGARFDMETDAAFALILSALAWRLGAAGPWVLLLGGMRYLYVLAALGWPWLMDPLPQKMRRKTICVIQIATLAGLLAPVAVPPWSTAAALAALILLAGSFAADILWLARRRR